MEIGRYRQRGLSSESANGHGQPEERARAQRDAVRIGFVVLAGVGVAVHGAFAATGTSSSIVDDWLYCGLYLMAAAACALRAHRGDARGAWGVAAVGVLVWGAAEIVYRIVAPAPDSWYPKSSQVLLFIGFSLAYTTLAMLARERVRKFDPVLALDALLAGLAAAAFAALLLFPVLGGVSAHAPAAPPVVFLLAALVGLAFVVTVVGMTGWRPGPAWALIAFAITINVCGDAVLVDMTNAGTFHRGSVADTLFVGSALLLGLAAFHPSRHAAVAYDQARRLPIALFAAAAALGLLIAAVAHGAGGLTAGLAAAALAVTIVRMSVALELLERSRRQALADDLTGLGNRRQLVRDLGRRLGPTAVANPFILALFDLDGFKRYNDTFGHPSGDALLVRLAGRLADAVAPGSAYRMGGDEFCAIVDGADNGAATTLERAHAALSERGDGFSITSSSGSVTCPQEATSVSAALGIADGRMYVAKARRTIVQAQTRDAVLRMLHERDPALHEHMRGVASMAARVARRLGLDEEAVEQVARAAELHDVGKIAVPDAILHKAGKLDRDEWRFMRQHPIIGERILRSAPSLAPIAPLVRSAHERWDGSGYPDGLRRSEPPIGARIIAACDAYDAMCSAKPYRGAHTPGDALAELRRAAGRKFDPAVVDALCAELEAPVSA